MFKLSTPVWVKRHDLLEGDPGLFPESVYADIRQRMANFHSEQPDISIVIIAYNEERNLLRTLSSLADTQSKYRVELLVVNNNSSDRTQEILDRCGIRSIIEKRQGIGFARQAGLEGARGRIVVNGDADTIYPPAWAEALSKPLLEDAAICASYGRYAFIPSIPGGRLFLSFYEACSALVILMRRAKADPVNVLGFSFAFRRDEAIAAGGFPVKAQYRWEDGQLILRLLKQHGGRLHLVWDRNTHIWTSDRRLFIENSGYFSAFLHRVVRQLGRVPHYLGFPLRNRPSFEPQKGPDAHG